MRSRVWICGTVLLGPPHRGHYTRAFKEGGGRPPRRDVNPRVLNSRTERYW